MALFTKQKSLHGQDAYLTPDTILVGKAAIGAGGERSVGRQGGSIVLPGSPAYVVAFDDFLGDVIADQWNSAEGDTGHDAVAVRAQTNGVARLHMSSTAAKTPAGYIILNTGLFPQWKSNQGKLRIAGRLKVGETTLTGANVFFGLTDTGASQMPIYDTGGGSGTPLSPASNAVGWLLSRGAASPSTVWRGVAVNADTDATPISGDAPTLNTYDVLEIEIQDSGNVAVFYQNGVIKGVINSPVLSTRGMVPVLAAFSSESTGNVVDLDWINVSALRDTGE
jgi:hypothetical protein